MHIMQLPVFLLQLTVSIFSVQQQVRILFLCMRVDEETGLPTKKFTLPISGDYPKDLVLFPDNKHLAIAKIM